MEKPHQLDHPPCLQCSHSKPNQVQSRLSLLSIGSYWQKSSPSAMTYSDSGLRDTLAFRLPSHKFDNSSLTNDPGVWGHEYACHLPAEIGEAYQAVQSNHKGEADVIDLLERESINDIVPFVAEHDYSRVCNYMLSRVKFLVPPDDTNFLQASTVICVAGMMICTVYSKNMILAHDNSMLGEDKIRLEKENENNKSRLEKENENNESRLEKENENNKSRLEKENQDNKIRWEKENSKLDTELKEVKAKHGQIISPDYKIIIKLVLQGLKLDCDVSSIHRYTL
ncbi:hypothetical protein MJO29_006510 [Puccinia striiformis f. sp. tritici]|nr:hypothetical protein MJO29_006510 [Puccinia striiformis f. sp. tritici]